MEVLQLQSKEANTWGLEVSAQASNDTCRVLWILWTCTGREFNSVTVQTVFETFGRPHTPIADSRKPSEVFAHYERIIFEKKQIKTQPVSRATCMTHSVNFLFTVLFNCVEGNSGAAEGICSFSIENYTGGLLIVVIF